MKIVDYLGNPLSQKDPNKHYHFVAVPIGAEPYEREFSPAQEAQLIVDEAASVARKAYVATHPTIPLEVTVSGIQTTVSGMQTASQAWPVGSIFISAVSTNPATMLGYGTWQAFGAGRCLFGLDAAQTEFNTASGTGGAKTKTLAVTEMPPHTHIQDAHNHTQTAHSHTRNTQSSATGTSTTIMARGGTTNTGNIQITDATTAVNVATTATNQNTGGGQAFSILPPYVVVFFWRRTA